MSGAAAQGSEIMYEKREGAGITLLARDPNWLFVYWDIPRHKNEAFSAELGDELWKKSVPVLKVSNITRNESFFIRINEFSDNWYINVQDSNNLYVVEIGRKISENCFISISRSNGAITPGDNISPDTTACFANYIDLKNGRFEIRSGSVSDPFIYGGTTEWISGLSSPGLYGGEFKEEYHGESSAAVYGNKLRELPGVGSDSFVKG